MGFWKTAEGIVKHILDPTGYLNGRDNVPSALLVIPRIADGLIAKLGYTPVEGADGRVNFISNKDIAKSNQIAQNKEMEQLIDTLFGEDVKLDSDKGAKVSTGVAVATASISYIGIIILVLMVLGSIFSGSKRKRRRR